MRSAKRWIWLWAWLGLCWTVSAQSLPSSLTTIVGEVYDAETGQVLPNVNVYLQGTSIGTTTTPEGVFLLRTQLQRKATMVVSSVGYQKQKFVITPGQSAGLQVMLQPQSQALSEVMVSPGTNPALSLMQKVRQNKKQNDIPAPPTQQQQIQVCLSDIQAKHLKKRIWRSLQAGMVAMEDSSFLVPLYFCREQNGKVEEKTSLMTATDWHQLLADHDRFVSFYHNTIPFYTATLISPLANDGGTYYRYYLVDSLEMDGRKTYQVDFRTKNPYYPTFNGTIMVDSASYALRSVDATIPHEVNLNYLHNLHFVQHFSVVDSVDSVPRFAKQFEQVVVSLDFAVKGDSSHVFPSVLIMQQRQYMGNGVGDSSLHLLPVDTLSSRLDQAMETPVFRAASMLAYIIQTGYFPTDSYVEFGKLNQFLNINPYETIRLGLPLRTTEKMSRRVCLEAYAGYGVGDRAWKGAGMIHFNLPARRRNVLSLRYADEYVPLEYNTMMHCYRENTPWCSSYNLTGYLTKNIYQGENVHETAVRRREFRVSTENDWTEHLETRFDVRAGTAAYGEPTHDYSSQSDYRFASFSALVRLGWKEKKVDFFFHRVHVYSHLPVLYLNAELGSTQLSGQDSYNMYGRLGVMVRQRLQLGVAGRVDYTVEGGVVLGKVPYTMLQVFAGNQSYAFDLYRNTLMHNGQYAADRYLQVQAEWNGHGCLFNLIPGIRYLRLRELFDFKLAYGDYSQKTLLDLDEPVPYDDLRIPYVELGVGIGNIFRIGDLYSVWRVTHVNDPGAPAWSMRFRLHIEP